MGPKINQQSKSNCQKERLWTRNGTTTRLRQLRQGL